LPKADIEVYITRNGRLDRKRYIDAPLDEDYVPEPQNSAGGKNSDFPSFSTLLSNYPLPYDIRPDRTPVNSRIPVSDLNQETFLYYNQCAIRLSIALKKSGLDLSGAKNYSNPKGNPYGNGNILGAQNLAQLLKDKYLGPPEKFDGTKQDVQKLLSGRKGIIFFQNIVEDGIRSYSNVHIELWDKSHYMSSFDFKQMFGATVIWFWPLK
jgi:hypothetical protein